MFIHIGNGNVIRSSDIITIIDQSVVSSSSIMEELMSKKKADLIGPSEDVKSVVITNKLIYLSTLSITTLKKRASMMSTISKLDDYTDELELE